MELFFIFVLGEILDLSSNMIKHCPINISERKIWYKVFDTILKHSTKNFTYTCKLSIRIICIQSEAFDSKWKVMDTYIVPFCSLFNCISSTQFMFFFYLWQSTRTWLLYRSPYCFWLPYFSAISSPPSEVSKL